MMVAAAVIGAGVIGAGGAMIAGNEQAGAQKNAANTEQGMFNTIKGQEQPFMQAGYGATSRLADLMGTSGNTGASGYGSLTSNFTPQDYLNNQDPGYQFQLQQGAAATRNADTPGVGALSGAALKDLTAFNQNMASTGYQNAFNRFQTNNQNIYARLSGLAGLGQNAASNTGTAGTQLGIGAAQAGAAAGGSEAGGIVGATNNLSGAGMSLGYLMSGQNTANAGGIYATGGNGTGAYYDAGTGTTYNNPSGYVAPGGS